MSQRLPITKTYKLFINGQFPRSESGRTIPLLDEDERTLAHVCRASKKDFRNAVETARKAQPDWAGRSAYNRGQILYRMAEMLEGKMAEFIETLLIPPLAQSPYDENIIPPPEDEEQASAEVRAAIDRLIAYAGWTDKFSQILSSQNPVNGPYDNTTKPEPVGVVAVVAPDQPSLLGLISMIAPPLCVGNTVVVLASEVSPIPASIFGEVCATSDVPAGVINLLTSLRFDLIEPIATHRDIDAIHAANVESNHEITLRAGTADNLKRVTIRNLKLRQWFNPDQVHHPWWIEPFVEHKTIWHPTSI